MKKMSLPSGRKSLCASGSHLCGLHQRLAPYSDTARSKLSLSKGTSSALPAPVGTWGRTRAGTSPRCEVEPSQSRPRPGGALVARATPRSRRCRSRARSRPRAIRIRPEGGPPTLACPRAPRAAPLPATLSVRLRCGRVPTVPTRPCCVRCIRARASAGSSSNSGWIAVPSAP